MSLYEALTTPCEPPVAGQRTCTVCGHSDVDHVAFLWEQRRLMRASREAKPVQADERWRWYPDTQTWEQLE